MHRLASYWGPRMWVTETGSTRSRPAPCLASVPWWCQPAATARSLSGMLGLKSVRPPIRLHAGCVRAVAIAEVIRQGAVPQSVIVSGSTDKIVVISDPVTGEFIGTPFTGHRRGVRALATTALTETPIVISGDDAGVVLAWELESRALITAMYRTDQGRYTPSPLSSVERDARGWP